MPLINLEQTLRSMNGYDEIAVQNMFRVPLKDLDGTTASRVAVFLTKRREGTHDGEAFKQSMELTIADLESLIDTADEADDEGKAGTATSVTS